MIRIASRLRPFSHLPGASCLIPGTGIEVEAFPALIRLKNSGKEIPLEIKGPLKQFTLMQDLERGCVTVFSEQYRLHVLPNGEITDQKNPPLPPIKNQERLSLGSHKKQEWEGIKRRLDPCEFFPLWFRLGFSLELPPRPEGNVGMFGLLAECREAIEAHTPERIIPAFQKLFLAGFRGILVPRLRDDEHQGIVIDNAIAPTSALYLLQEGAALIRSLFLVSSGNELAILPNLPPELFAGRMLNLACPGFGELDLEWTKKTIRQIEFRAACDGELHLRFPSAIRTFRLRGKICGNGEALEIKSGDHYVLDQFKK